MSIFPDSRPPSPLRAKPRPVNSPELPLKDDSSLKDAIFNMQQSEPDLTLDPSAPDPTSSFSDELLLRVFYKLPVSHRLSITLVCKRWLKLHGRLVNSLKLYDWSLLESGRLCYRFPSLSDIDIVNSCIKSRGNSGIFVTHKLLSVHVNSGLMGCGFVEEDDWLPSASIDNGLRMIAKWYPNLRRLVATGVGEHGLLSIAEECQILQELELHCCGDTSLKGISRCRNLQIVRLISFVEGFYSSVVSDIGLTILAQGCRRLVKLELCGCEGSYDGIKAIGQCCHMLEELTLCDHRMDGGWLAAISYCANLKTLSLQSCKNIDLSPGPDEHLGSCSALEELHLHRCHMRGRESVMALFSVCKAVRRIILQDCWGLENDVFNSAVNCRRVRFLSLEGCSLLTMEGLETVVLSWNELQRLRVVSCNKIKDNEVTPAMASLFSVLKELQWRPDSASHLSSSLEGTGMGRKGYRFFNRSKA